MNRELADFARAWMVEYDPEASPEPFVLWYVETWPEGNKSLHDAYWQFRDWQASKP